MCQFCTACALRNRNNTTNKSKSLNVTVFCHIWGRFSPLLPFGAVAILDHSPSAFAVVSVIAPGFCSGGQGMKVRFIVLALLALFATNAATASAQSQTGEIFGKVTDQSGAVLP